MSALQVAYIKDAERTCNILINFIQIRKFQMLGRVFIFSRLWSAPLYDADIKVWGNHLMYSDSSFILCGGWGLVLEKDTWNLPSPRSMWPLVGTSLAFADHAIQSLFDQARVRAFPVWCPAHYCILLWSADSRGSRIYHCLWGRGIHIGLRGLLYSLTQSRAPVPWLASHCQKELNSILVIP